MAASSASFWPHFLSGESKVRPCSSQRSSPSRSSLCCLRPRVSATSGTILLDVPPCGFFPKRFLFAKINTARRLQKEIGGEIVFFFHDSDQDPRETITIVQDRRSGHDVALNFQFENRIQKKFSPLYAQRILPDWQAKTARQLPNYVGASLVEDFKKTKSSNVADFCLEMYKRMSLLKGLRVERSSAPDFRQCALAVPDYFVDVRYEGEIVRARYRDGKLLLHKGGDRFLEI